MEHVNILEAARLCGVSDKTIRRPIHKGSLPASFPKPNRCEIAVSDLERCFPGQQPGHVQVAAEQRLAALERRIEVLEQQVQEWRSKLEAGMPRRSPRKGERSIGPLPKRLVSLLAFAALHHVPEQKVLTHVNMDIPLLKAVRGEWTDHDGTMVKLALDSSGRRVFYQLYRELPYFLRCSQCPHDYLDTV